MKTLRFDKILGKIRDNDRFPPKHEYLSQQYVQSLGDLPSPAGKDIVLGDKVYTIDGELDIEDFNLIFGEKTQIIGIGQNVSRIKSSASGTPSNKRVFFQSTTNLFMNKLEIVCEGTNQRVWQNIGDGTVTEGESFELNEFNVLCFEAPGHGNELGFIKDIRQGFIGTMSAIGFESGFICAGNWSGGFRVDNTIFIDCSGVFFGSDPLDPVVFARRMSSNANVSVPSGSIGYDFPPSAFTNTGQYQLSNGNFSGAGTYVTQWEDPANLGVFRNPAFDPKALFEGNTNLQNTFQGGEWINTTDTVTVIPAANVWVDLNITTVNKFLTWYEELNGVFTYKGGNPLDVTSFLTLSLTGKANDIVEVRLIKEDASAVLTELLRRQITIQGTTAQGRAESVPIQTTDQQIFDDKTRVQIRNTSGNSNITCLANSNCIIGAK